MPRISGELMKADNRDTFDRGLEPGDYTYSLKATAGGKVSIKIKQSTFHIEGKKFKKSTGTIENKSKVASGSTLNGKFTVIPYKTHRDHDYKDTTPIKFIFSRAALTKGVCYDFNYELDD